MNKIEPFDLPSGYIIGERFEIKERISRGRVSAVYKTMDRKHTKVLALRVFRPDLFEDVQELRKLRERITLASRLLHKNIILVFGLGKDDLLKYVLMEFVQGLSLKELIEKRKEGSTPFSMRTVYNIITHISNALSFAHLNMTHGALSPSKVLITPAGRVKVGGFGLGPEVLKLDERERDPFIAPEVISGLKLSEACDIYSLGAILYQLLTLSPPPLFFRPPSEICPYISPEIDKIIERCLEPKPKARFSKIEEVKDVLKEVIENHPDELEQEPALASEPSLEIEIATQPIIIERKVKTPLPKKDIKPALPPPPPPPKPLSKQELQQLITNLVKDKTERWMVVKNGFDHGPFTTKDIFRLFLNEGIEEKDNLTDITTGEKREVINWPEFQNILKIAKRLKTEEEIKRTFQQIEKKEKKENLVKYLLGASICTCLILGFLIFFFSRPEWKPREKLKGELADLAELKALQITLTRSKLEIKARQKRRKEKSQVEKEDSYEQDMVRSLDMEDQEKTETLSQSKVQAIINAKSKVLYSCIYREVQQNPSLKRVDIRFVIHSNGQVGGVTVSQGSEEFQTCIRTKMRKITFPSFSGPKVGAHFSLLVEQ